MRAGVAPVRARSKSLAARSRAAGGRSDGDGERCWGALVVVVGSEAGAEGSEVEAVVSCWGMPIVDLIVLLLLWVTFEFKQL